MKKEKTISRLGPFYFLLIFWIFEYQEHSSISFVRTYEKTVWYIGHFLFFNLSELWCLYFHPYTVKIERFEDPDSNGFARKRDEMLWLSKVCLCWARNASVLLTSNKPSKFIVCLPSSALESMANAVSRFQIVYAKSRQRYGPAFKAYRSTQI